MRFVEWILVGDKRFACDAFSCERALEAGVVSFQALGPGRARVAVSFDYEPAEAGDGKHGQLKAQMQRDLVRFKELVEVEGAGRHRHSEQEHVAMSAAEIVAHSNAPHENAGRDIDGLSRRRIFNQ